MLKWKGKQRHWNLSGWGWNPGLAISGQVLELTGFYTKRRKYMFQVYSGRKKNKKSYLVISIQGEDSGELWECSAYPQPGWLLLSCPDCAMGRPRCVVTFHSLPPFGFHGKKMWVCVLEVMACPSQFLPCLYGGLWGELWIIRVLQPHTSMSQTDTSSQLSDKYLSQRQHFQDWFFRISASLHNVLLRTLSAVGPILGCQPPPCASAVGALAHVILRAFWLPFHSLPFTCSFVPFLLGCHRNVSQHFWGGCFLCCQLFSCCYSYGLEPTNLILFFQCVLITGVRLMPTLSLLLGGILQWHTPK